MSVAKLLYDMKQQAVGLSAKEGRLKQISYFLARPKQTTLAFISETSDIGLITAFNSNFTDISCHTEPESDEIAFHEEECDDVFGNVYNHYTFHIIYVEPWKYLIIRRKRDHLSMISRYTWWIEKLFTSGIHSKNYSCWLAVETFKCFTGSDLSW